MTRDEVARECERLGWELITQTFHGDDGTSESISMVVDPSDMRILGEHVEEQQAYYEACRREQVTPF